MAAFLKAQTDAYYVVVDALVATNTIRILTITAMALGLMIPESFLLRADELID
jgi:hypothetical protein